MMVNGTFVAQQWKSFQKKCNLWSVADEELYALCKKYPDHSDRHAVIAKLWVIGRTYAAALERRKKRIATTDELYQEVADRLCEKLDADIARVKRFTALSPEALKEVLYLHNKMIDYLKAEREAQTFPQKRSLASKYLHFHLPNLVPIYDSRVSTEIVKLVQTSRKKDFEAVDISRYEDAAKNVGDAQYRNYCLRLMALKECLQIESLRELDSFLLFVSDEEQAKKRSQ